MHLSRRSAIKLISAGLPAVALTRNLRAQSGLHIQSGPFEGTKESLQRYSVPDWFRDAKFGIWSHWGPQSAIEQGDWYARNMYIQGSRQYEYHVANFGHPSKVGYKDLCPSWRAAEFDPNHLMSLYKRAGARYFVSMGVHHDNFDLWDSKHTRWNAVRVGPQKDIVGMWRKAAESHGLRFGVTEHLWISYKWFAVSHGSDSTGTLTGVPYDGVNAAYADLYHDSGCTRWSRANNPRELGWDDAGIPDLWKQHWFLRIQDLVDHYQPDLLYTDGPLPFEGYGYGAVANLYNQSAQRAGGKVDAVYTSKQAEDCAVGTCVLDFERGLANEIRQAPWQTDTCIGSWHYDINILREHKYKTPKTVVDMLVDVVSQNGNLLLNFPLPNSGRLDSDELAVLDGITRWMTMNSEGIYGTRPWKVYGEGPSVRSEAPGSAMNERSRQPLNADEIRFTTKKSVLYAFIMGWPDKEATVQALGTASPQQPAKVVNVELLGHAARLKWAQEPAALRVYLPSERPSDYAIALKVTFAKDAGL